MRARPEPRAEPVDQACEVGSLRHLAGKIDLRRGQRLGAEHGEAHHVEAEAGIPFGCERRKPFGEEHGDGVRRAERRRRADLGASNLAVDAEERCLEKARAEPVPLERRARVCARARRRS